MGRRQLNDHSCRHSQNAPHTALAAILDLAPPRSSEPPLTSCPGHLFWCYAGAAPAPLHEPLLLVPHKLFVLALMHMLRSGSHLLIEDLPGEHGDNARLLACRLQLLCCLHCQVQLRACTHAGPCFPEAGRCHAILGHEMSFTFMLASTTCAACRWHHDRRHHQTHSHCRHPTAAQQDARCPKP